MRGALTIAWKDYKGLVLSPMFFFLTFLCCSIWSYSYMRGIFEFVRAGMMASMGMGQAENNIHFSLFVQHIAFVHIIFIFAIPALTMRLVAEEKKMRTYDLLLTSPVTASAIAIGKFLAGFLTTLSIIVISFLYIWGMRAVADFSMGPVWTSFLGLSLVSALYVAVGLFASSLTQSVMWSMLMGVLFNLTLWFLSQGTEFSDSPLFQSVMQQLALGQHFYTFIKGTISISALAFFLTAIALFVFLTQRVIESSRWR